MVLVCRLKVRFVLVGKVRMRVGIRLCLFVVMFWRCRNWLDSPNLLAVSLRLLIRFVVRLNAIRVRRVRLLMNLGLVLLVRVLS